MADGRPAVRPTPTILVTGATGQVGHELVRALAQMATVVAPTRDVLDLENESSIRAAMQRIRPNAVVNAGAYTAVDRAESESDRCMAANTAAPAILAEELAASGGALVHYSTDYVFDGSASRPYVESDPVAPLNSYGRAKAAGERLVAATGVPHLIFRTSWVYGLRGHNFVRTMLRLARERDELHVVADQAGTPTWSRSIAGATAAVLARLLADPRGLAPAMTEVAGVYHLTAAGRTTWHGVAEAVLALDPARGEHRARRVVPIATAAFPTPAARPANSLLNSDLAHATLGVRIPDWREQLALALTP